MNEAINDICIAVLVVNVVWAFIAVFWIRRKYPED